MLQPPFPGVSSDKIDEEFRNAVEVVVHYDRASASLLQRRLSIGYARAARLIDQLEAAGVLGPMEGSAPREVLIKSVDEILGKNGVNKQKEEEWIPESPKNYKVPSGLKLSKVNDVPWGKQFSNVFSRNDFKDSKSDFPLPLGFDDDGKLHTESLIDVKNLIITGNTLSQKENLVDTILLTFLLRYAPAQVKFILIDSTYYLDLYDGIPHLLSLVIHDHSKTVSALKWAQIETERRLKQFSETGVRDIQAFNEKSGFMALLRILIIAFCEFFDIETEDSFVRLTAQGVRTGIHSIIVVDRAS